MSLVIWSFHNLNLPMLDIDGELYCANKVLTKALGTTDAAIRKIYARDKSLGDGCVPQDHAIELMREHRSELGLKYVRKDMRLWSEDAVIKLAMRTNSATAEELVVGHCAKVQGGTRRV